jgi:hypothetical protein
MRAKFIYEKFIEDSDPIHDMGIGMPGIIKKWLDEMQIKNYHINDDLTIDINNTVCLDRKFIGKLPKYIQFNTAYESFTCNDCKLTTLKGVPYYIKGFFGCDGNYLTSLKYAPKRVDRSFFLNNKTIKFTREEIGKVCNTSFYTIYVGQ